MERQPTKHVRSHTHKLKPLNHFTVVPHPLYPPRVVMDISLRNISMHYIRIHFGYAPRTHILNALLERKERLYLSCPTKIARIYLIRIPDMRVRIQGYIIL